jgi:hypothetical protein
MPLGVCRIRALNSEPERKISDQGALCRRNKVNYVEKAQR